MTSIVIGRKYIFLLLIGLHIFSSLIPYVSSEDESEKKDLEFVKREPAECIFCKIVGGKMPETKIELQTDEFVIFKDIKPAAPHHYLAVSRRHIGSLQNLTTADEYLISHMEIGLKYLLTKKGVDTSDALFGFHMPPFISVGHLHMHGIAPTHSLSSFNRLKYLPGSRWFKTSTEALHYIREKKRKETHSLPHKDDD